MELSTDRLLLRPFKASDLPHIQRYAMRPEYIRFLPRPVQTAESVAAYLNERLQEQRQQNGGRFHFAIEPKGSKRVVGAIRLTVLDPVHRQAELGYAMDSAVEGRGFMTEAVKRILEFGFNELDLHRISAGVDVDNDRSWRLLERAGMTREGRMREEKCVRGEWRDAYLYAMLADDPRP
ncbi:MAG: GNAT family protein [Alphaproteobacteria bacterium]|nr:GNAT family protein [Alphaproteobacteria bacterium]